METSTLQKIDTQVRIEQVTFTRLHVLRRLNRQIFGEDRIINRFDRPDLLMLIAYRGKEPLAFKVGYGESATVFYSAKGGVLEGVRRQGIALGMLHEMEDLARGRGYERFAFDTFPNRHPGMVILGLMEGYRVTLADFNSVYQDYRIRLEKGL